MLWRKYSTFSSFQMPTASQLSIECGSLDVSQAYGPPRPVTGIILPYFYILKVKFLVKGFISFLPCLNPLQNLKPYSTLSDSVKKVNATFMLNGSDSHLIPSSEHLFATFRMSQFTGYFLILWKLKIQI
jgi:hypothetical protein